MKVLVIGSGCREHALVKALLEDKKISAIYTLPKRLSLKNTLALPADLKNPEALADMLLKEQVELVIIGPEQPLIEGYADILREKGINVFGPSRQSAQLEGSKIFAKQFMKEYGIPTASYSIVHSVSEVLQVSENFFPPYVLKADGLAGGKGVFICQNLTELEQKSRLIFEKKIFGKAGEKALLEDFQKGQELSVFMITDGNSYHILPLARDYKRLKEGQKGPNTGGMGAVAPVTLDPEALNNIENLIIQPTLKGLRDRNYIYRGVLYFGLMLDKNMPKVLEYNVRFGDPEAQVLLPLLEGSWGEVFYRTACAQAFKMNWKKQFSACVALCSPHYPEGPFEPVPIKGLIEENQEDSWFLHGSLFQKDNQWFGKGGRILNAVALEKTPDQALKKAYKQAKKVSWPGIQYRKDIGT